MLCVCAKNMRDVPRLAASSSAYYPLTNDPPLLFARLGLMHPSQYERVVP